MNEPPKINGSIDTIMEALLSADPTQLNNSFVLKTIFGPDYQIPEITDVDPEVEIQKETEIFETAINAMVESLKPKPLSIPIEKVEDLSCKMQGDELYSEILKQIYEKKNPGKTLSGFTNSKQAERKIATDSPDILQEIKEEIFDNISPSVLGKPFNYANKKSRTVNVLGLPISFDIIMSGNQPVHFSLKSSGKSASEASREIKEILSKRKSGRKPCENEDTNEGELPDDVSIYPDDLEAQEREFSDLDSDYPDSGRDFTIDEPPLIDERDCDPPYPQDPLTGEPLFNIEDLERIKEETCVEPVDFPTREKEASPITLPEVDIIGQIDQCLDQVSNKQKELINNVDLLSRFIKLEQQVEEIHIHYRIIDRYYEDLFLEWNKYKQGNPLSVFNSSSIFNYISSLNSFSVRFKGTLENANRTVNFTFSYPTLRQDDVPYEEVDEPQMPNLSGGISQATNKVIKVDKKKIKIGQEYKQDGVLFGRPNNFFDGVNKALNFIHTGAGGISEIADFYDFAGDVQGSSKSKSQIISEIQSKRGFLYGQLIEKSALPWLFFTPEERGDNDARDPSKLKPSSFNPDGEPNSNFLDFWGNYKSKWDERYQQTYNALIEPRINSIISSGRSAAALCVSIASLAISGAEEPEDFDLTQYIQSRRNSIRSKMNEVEDLLIFIGTKINELNNATSPEKLKNDFNVSCSGGAPAPGGQAPAPFPRRSPSCPPPCCGPAGSDFQKDNYLQSSSGSSDCPTIYQVCWWKEFCKKATLLGLLPYPNGIPPVEDVNFFLTPGPSVRFGFRYWPVGYIPPAFIPISPAVNPIDGLPYLRIPLPMIWTIIDPIVIPLPFGLGILVIFIPFIGGFMPTPLVYLKENLFGTSLFLTGIRGPRFIPRKSDPKIKDILQKLKEKITHGIPDKLIPLPGFGKEILDTPKNIMGEMNSNINKIMDRVEPLKNTSILNGAQEKEKEIKNLIDQNQKEYKKRAALYDDEKPIDKIPQEEIDQIINARKDALSKTIKEFFDKKMPSPRDIYFPKDKDKLKFGIPSALNFKANRENIAKDLSPTECPKFVNLRSEMKSVLREMRIGLNPLLYPINRNLTNSNSVLILFPGDPQQMSRDEFISLVAQVKTQMAVTSHKIMKGNKKSISKRLREGAFSLVSSANYTGIFNFPEFKITDGAPGTLKFKTFPDPQLEAMYLRIMAGVAGIELERNDFAEYTRNITPELTTIISSIPGAVENNAQEILNIPSSAVVMRVKDFKKLLAKKMGLGKATKNNPIAVEKAVKEPTNQNIITATIPILSPKDIIDREEPLISKYPHPQGLFGCLEPACISYGTAFMMFEFPQVFPPKQDQISQTLLAGGIPRITIPGSVIKSFLSSFIEEFVENSIETIMPEINDIDSPKFMNLNSQDIVKITRKILNKATDPNGAIPSFLSATQIPVIPPARPTGIAEMAVMSLGAPPPARLPLSLLWKNWMGSPKIPLADMIINPVIEVASKILSYIPWPIIPLLGRHVINLLSPIALSDDLPDWKRLSLKNAYFVVYLDEFLRSAADVSGLFKFCFGTADPVYPIPELPSELQKAFNEDYKKF